MRIGHVTLGRGQPCRVIAELSNAHNGKLDRMIRLMGAMKSAGADLLKIQAYTPDELVALRGNGPAPEPWGSQGWTMRSLYEKARTPFEWYPALFDEAQKLGLPLFASVFGVESLHALQEAGCPAYKISSFERHAVWLISEVEQTGRPIVISAPHHRDFHKPIWVPHRALYCPPGYPNHPADYHLRMAFSEPHEPWPFDGVSLHCTDPDLPVTAVACGAKILELHVHLAQEPSELEADVSWTEFQVQDLVTDIRRTEETLR